MTIDTGSFPKSLLPQVDTFWGLGYQEMPEVYSKIFEVVQASGAFDEDVGMEAFGPAVFKPEGGDYTYQSMKQSFVKRYVQVAYGLAYAITHEAIRDNKYPQQVVQRSKAMGRSMKQTMELVTALILMRAFDSNYTGADGVSLSNTAHPRTKGGNYSNTLSTPADFSEYALEQALNAVEEFEDEGGIRIYSKGMMAIVPVERRQDAARVIRSPMKNDTAENAINANMELGLLPQGFMVHPYLESEGDWFIKTNVEYGLRFFLREAPAVFTEPDFNSRNSRFASYMSFAAGWTNPMGLFCIEGTN